MEAEVSLPAIEKSTVTNERGRFQLAELPPGQYDVRVRRIGYRELSVPVSVPEHGAVEREMVLARVAVLDTVAVQASVVIPSFEENRRIGLGKFLTRADLEKQENRKLAEILEQVGAKALRNGHRAWIGGGRGGQKSIMNRGGRKCAQLEGAEPRNDPRVQRSPGNPGCGCFALVFMNDALIYNGETGATVPDVNSIVPASIEAIEFYKGPASTPLKYSRLTSECGVLVLHTRRTLGKTSTSKP